MIHLLHFQNQLFLLNVPLNSLQMPASLREAGVDLLALAGEKDGIVKSALEDACCRGNPVPVTAQMVRQLLQAVCG